MAPAYSLGALASPPDARDHDASRLVSPALASRRPPAGDLRGAFLDPILDQGNEGTCVAQAMKQIMGCYLKAQRRAYSLSARDLYEGARQVIPVQGEGSHPRAACSWARNRGGCREQDWSYVAGQRGEPGPYANANRPDHKISGYARVVSQEIRPPRLDQGPPPFAPSYRELAQQLHATGPLLIVIPATESLYNPLRSGDSWRVLRGGQPLGLHAMVACGWREAGSGAEYGQLLLRNSWGMGWGDAGYAWIDCGPYDAGYSTCAEAWAVLGMQVQDRPAESPEISWWERFFGIFER